MRQVVLDTETTGLEVGKGHRIIEIGCVELSERRVTGRTLHRYFNPERFIDDGALAVHGITNEFLHDKPRFAEIAVEVIEFIRGAELIIHNAAFDVAFLDMELALADAAHGRVNHHAQVLDTLLLAREKYPGQKNSLDALCKRLSIDNSHRELHGALLDAQLLADVYLAMTGGQGDLGFGGADVVIRTRTTAVPTTRPALLVRYADAAEQTAHALRIAGVDKASKGHVLWPQSVVLGDNEISATAV
jgi:DNA polymerase-3 subunit epsilon